MTSISYGFGAAVSATDIEDAITKTTAALGEVGFGVLTRIDVHTTLKERLNEDLRPYAILGACNPGLALRAVKVEPHVGLLMPCNVLVQQSDNGFDVSIMDPEAFKNMADGDTIKGIMDETKTLLSTALGNLN
jgi:uncharacterized protein (DUF302 family)